MPPKMPLDYQTLMSDLKKLILDKKLTITPNCSYKESFYFCIGIASTPVKEIPGEFKKCVGCPVGKFLYALSFVPEHKSPENSVSCGNPNGEPLLREGVTEPVALKTKPSLSRDNSCVETVKGDKNEY